MSVAIGTPQPAAPGPPALTAAYSAAGTAMPAAAATTGRAAPRQVRSSPTTSSRLISRPTTRKNRVMRPSLTQWRRSVSRVRRPSWSATRVSHRAA